MPVDRGNTMRPHCDRSDHIQLSSTSIPPPYSSSN
ncbi:hypothetical protein AZE42_07855 [Rhizopogon vesiculosus]|uniref:Uncharacterized protein n=1 Tax=Rhizopogon vesiculosus TaxID=180088 RepID=A0A1J8R9Z8_9AGAM|nr:hypothetical protein AZE42_07855 [Rhizopogon vesiculosus]